MFKPKWARREGEEKDFMDVMLSSLKESAFTDELGGYDSETVIKATCWGMYLRIAYLTIYFSNRHYRISFNLKGLEFGRYLLNYL